MTCPTAARWFVSEAEWSAVEDDHALIDENAKLIRREIDKGNNDHHPTLPDGSLVPVYFDELSQELHDHRHTAPYNFATPGRMLWGDVDDSKPEQRKDIIERYKQKQLRAENEDFSIDSLPFSLITLEKAVSLLTHRDRRNDSAVDEDSADDENAEYQNDEEKSPSSREGDQEERESDNDKACRLLEKLFSVAQRHILKPRPLENLLRNGKDPIDKQQAVAVLTYQNPDCIERPLLILVGMIDSMQNPNDGEKNGWAIGYDVLKDVIICKPFFSDKNRHPLTSSWAAKHDDGISFTMNPQAFIKHHIALADELRSKLESGEIKKSEITCESSSSNHSHELEVPDITFIWQLAISAITARFVHNHWDGFVPSPPASNSEFGEDAFMDAMHHINVALRKIRVPVVPKVATDKKEQMICVCAVEEMEWQLEEQEEYFRECAVEAKKKGHEKVAENTAMLYEKVMGMVRAFNEDPEREV